jgi:aryl-alcohol dehydrogenase-like predicted oxidoreductase
MSPSIEAWSARRSSCMTPVPLVLGTMNFGKRTAEPEAQRMVHRALERGVVHFDTANAYVDGEGERILGRALRGRRHQALIATKVGLSRIDGELSGLIRAGGRSEGLSRARVVNACEESLARLGTDYIDLYFLHVPDKNVAIEESLAGLKQLLDAGKIRGWATSNYASWQLLEMLHWCDANELARPLLSQQMYNLLVRQLELEYFAFAAKYRLHTCVYNPLAGGLLAGHHRWGTPPAGSRFDDNPMYQRRYFSEELLRRVDDYKAIADSLGVSLASLAVAWLGAQPGVDSVAIGPGTLAQLDEAIGAAALRLEPQVPEALHALHLRHTGSDARYARL